jgi:antitoxin component YwqK of YwqJK toxin-antitoxin module
VKHSLLALLVCLSPRAEARNGAEHADLAAQDQYLIKINHACGTKLTMRHDLESLAKHNQDIARDQTSGSNECFEPLRYVWYACRSDAGKAQVRKLTQVVCKGTPSKVGSLSVQGSSITVERAFEEDKPFLRSRKQFEAALQMKLPIQTEDPYYDEDWNKLRLSENPVLDTKTYCMVNGEKKELKAFYDDSFERRKEDATIKCWEDGQVTIDLSIKHGIKTGFSTTRRDKVATRTSYRNGKLHGERRTTDDGKPVSIDVFDDGQDVSSTEYHKNGKLSRYSRHYPSRIDSVSLADDGRMISATCSPLSRDDRLLRKVCGFDGAVTHSFYDGTGKVSRIVTIKDGVVIKQKAGDSLYGSGSTVDFVDGHKDGEERVVDRDGKLSQIVHWSRGEKDGKEQHYYPGGQKLKSEQLWKAGQLQQQTELYMNGNPRERDSFDSPTKKRHQQFWDTGKLRSEVTMLRTDGRHGQGWAEEGAGKTYFESGQLESETEWKAGTRVKTRRWGADGKLLSDEEYEADGSRKIKR